MQVTFGIDAKKKKEEDKIVPVVWDTDIAINGHCLFMGMSGSGKSFTLRKVIKQMLATRGNTNVRFHVYDVHGDLTVDEASDVMFSMQTPYGLNPLRVSSDPHFGGPRRTIQNFISTMNRCMRALGVKQESCIRNLLTDVYTRHGFTDDPRTWHIEAESTRLLSDGSDNRFYVNVPKVEYEELRKICVTAEYDHSVGSWWIPPRDYQGPVTRWEPKLLKRTYPNISDVLQYAKHVLQMSFLGTGAEAIAHLEAANKAAQAYQRKLLSSMKNGNSEFEDEGLSEAIEKAKTKAINTFTDYANRISTGRELSDLIKYDSIDVLKSVIDRLETLIAIGIFKDAAPPFDYRQPVWRYDLRALSLREEKKLFVLYHISELFAQCVALGETNQIRHVLILDEAHIYADKDDENPIATIAKEGRKFGIALLLASQSPTHFNDDFITSVGSKIILGIDESYWKSSASKLMLDIKGLQWIKMQRNMLVQVKGRGDSRTNWICTTIQ